MSKIDLQNVAYNLFEKVFEENMPSPVKSYLYTLLGDESKAFLEWEKLAKVNLNLGDFSAYLNCTSEILKLLEKPEVSELMNAEIEEYKLNLYSNIAENLYDYVPNKVENIAEITLSHLEQTTDFDKIVELCNKMINGALLSSRYNQALSLTHKVLALIPNASIDPKAPNFNVYFVLMSLIHVEILFNIGAMEDCIDIGYKVLNVVDNSNVDSIKPSYISDAHFKEMITNCVGYVAMANLIQLKGNITDFLNVAYSSLSFIPKTYDIFIQLQELLFGRESKVSEDMIGQDNFSGAIYYIIQAFTVGIKDSQQFAEIIYKAKLAAHKGNLTHVEIFCDLLVGYAYVLIDAHEKASSIIYKIIKSSKQQGMHLLEHLGWYLLSELNIKQRKFDVAFGMLNNSIISMERYGKASDYLMLLSKYNMFKVMMYLGETEKAQMCLNQAYYISQKYGINFEFDIEPEHYITMPSEEELAQALSENNDSNEIIENTKTTSESEAE